MLSALLAGFGLALGHHFFYASLEHEPVPTGSYFMAGRNLTKQQFNNLAGIAFTFLVKIFLTTAMSTAYVQILWRSITNASRHRTLAELDWANASLTNIFQLFNLGFGWKDPFLVLLALLFWYVSIPLFDASWLKIQSIFVRYTNS